MNKLKALPKPVKLAFWVLLAILAYALPILEPPIISTPGVDFGGVLFVVTMYCLIALGLNIVVGYAGLLDLGYVGFYAVGAYTAAILTSFHANWPLLLSLPFAVAATTIAGLILGAPTLRVRGDYLAIVTLGFGEIIRLVAVNTEWLGDRRGISNIARPPSVMTGEDGGVVVGEAEPGLKGIFEIPHLYWGDGTVLVDTEDTTQFLVFGVLDQIPYYWLGLTVVLLVLLADYLIKNSRVGRAWEATREDEDAAELMGVPTFKFKLLAFATGAFIGGLAGALFASRQSFINPDSFLLLFSILFLAAVVVGGQGNRWGVLVGAFLVAYLPQRFRDFDDFRVLVFGAALVALAILRPEGLFPPRRTVRAKQMEHELEVLETGHDDGEEAARV
ncbi:branched-chain amino acid ABC transporter permease [Nocardioides antri]|uniref:Branched-chain amino acid ABC transporter permease n=1 Tax=Nocardioides antri TaxID=2607659 RepID=A0A5B1MAK9_9ACTN|nr:branched-chain amino acid ABC transporter permease [Nocardioides antri]KAA1429039.1 branched-chain amino acid ABC transporter permease [Nocardioides antri]